MNTTVFTACVNFPSPSLDWKLLDGRNSVLFIIVFSESCTVPGPQKVLAKAQKLFCYTFHGKNQILNDRKHDVFKLMVG